MLTTNPFVTVSKCAHDKTDILFKAAVNQAFLSICTRASKRRLELVEEVDEDKERHGADWQGTKQPSQLALTPIMNGQGDTLLSG